jgi:hypothetical protein
VTIQEENKADKRDQEMHQTRKGNQWSFGMKVHLSVNKDPGQIHSVVTIAANVQETSRLQLNCSIAMREWSTAMLAGDGRQDQQVSVRSKTQHFRASKVAQLPVPRVSIEAGPGASTAISTRAAAKGRDHRVDPRETPWDETGGMDQPVTRGAIGETMRHESPLRTIIEQPGLHEGAESKGQHNANMIN